MRWATQPAAATTAEEADESTASSAIQEDASFS